MPGTTTPEPVPFEQVTVAQLPVGVDHGEVGGRAQPVAGASSAARRERRARRRSLVLVEPGVEVARSRRAFAASIAATISSTPAVPEPLEQPERSSAIRIPPEDGGGLVRTSRPRKRARDRLALDRLVGGQVRRGRERAAALRTQSQTPRVSPR